MQYTTNILPFDPVTVYQCAYSVLMSYKKPKFLSNMERDIALSSFLTIYAAIDPFNNGNVACLLTIEPVSEKNCRLRFNVDQEGYSGNQRPAILLVKDFLMRLEVYLSKQNKENQTT